MQHHIHSPRVRRIAAATGLGVALTLAVTGCGSGLIADASAGSGDDAMPRIAFDVPVAANPYWDLQVTYAEAAAEQLGFELVVGDANSQEDTQINQVQSQIAGGVDGIVISPVTDSVGTTVLASAEQAGIPVVFMQRSPGLKPDDYDGSQYVGFVGTDDVQGGTLTAEALYEAGIRKVVAMTGAQGNSVAEDRIAGLTDFAAAHSDMTVLQQEFGNELREDGQQTMENLLSAYPGPGFDGVWAFNDETAIGAVRALSNAGSLENVAVTGMDGTPDGVQAILDGEILSGPGGGYVCGSYATVMLYDALNGNDPKSDFVLLPYVDISADNAEKFKTDFLGNPSGLDFRALSATYTEGASTDDYVITLE